MSLSVMRRFSSCVLVAAVAFAPVLSAQTHVVNLADLQREMLAATGARQRNMDTVSSFLSTPRAQKALGSVGMDPSRVKTAVASLDDKELARLAARSEKAQADIAAGRLSDRDLIFVTLGLVALILIIIAVR